MSKAYASFSCSKLTTHLLQVLMNVAEVYASRMMLLLAPVSASALSRCSSLMTMTLATHYELSVCLLGVLYAKRTIAIHDVF
jgi:multisubunit Na+/H+ antiporter MnhG subunit